MCATVVHSLINKPECRWREGYSNDHNACVPLSIYVLLLDLKEDHGFSMSR